MSKSKIEDRFITYKNDALRYAKLLSQIERFESWGKGKEAGGIDGLLQADTLIRCRLKGSRPTGSKPSMGHSVRNLALTCSLKTTQVPISGGEIPRTYAKIRINI